MARCVKCGEEAAEPVWAIYADPAFEHKPQDPFPLHQECFEQAERITATEWVRTEDVGDRTVVDTSNDLSLVETDQLRYRRVEAP